VFLKVSGRKSNSMTDDNRGFPQTITSPLPTSGDFGDTRDFAVAESQARNGLQSKLDARYDEVLPLVGDKHVNANGPDAAFLATDTDGQQSIVAGSVKHYRDISASDIDEAAHTRDMMNAHSSAAAQGSDLVFNVPSPVHQTETFATYNPLDPSAPHDYMLDTLDAAAISGAAEASAREDAGIDHYVAMTTNAGMSDRSAAVLADRNIAYTHVTPGDGVSEIAETAATSQPTGAPEEGIGAPVGVLPPEPVMVTPSDQSGGPTETESAIPAPVDTIEGPTVVETSGVAVTEPVGQAELECIDTIPEPGVEVETDSEVPVETQPPSSSDVLSSSSDCSVSSSSTDAESAADSVELADFGEVSGSSEGSATGSAIGGGFACGGAC
jgi:hypothetical protein